MRIAYYITTHGYGHGVRSSDIIRALNKADPTVEVFITSALPESFLRNRLPASSNRYRSATFDVGMVQLDSVKVDVEATRQKVDQLVRQWDVLVDQEMEWLHLNNIDRVVVDIPAIPIDAAKKCELPCIAVGNFAWDWIYAPFEKVDARWQSYIDKFARTYGKADRLLKLPFSEPMVSFKNHIDMPLLSAPGIERREELSRLTGADVDKKWILLSFTTLDWCEASLNQVEQLSDYEFFTVKPLAWSRKNIYAVDRAQVGFADVLASCDAVISKPGYGILSECVVNQKPFIYTEREDFVEYPVLVKAVKEYLQHKHIPAEDLYAGRLGDVLHEIWHQKVPVKKMAVHGAEKAVAEMLREAI